MRLRGGIFDIDGVVLDTPHERAWREALQGLMAGPWRDLVGQTGYSTHAFTSAVYQEQVAGKPRLAGASAALAYFVVSDADGARAREYAAAKQARLEGLAASGTIRVYTDAVRLLVGTRVAGGRACAASSSRNADGFLRAVRVAASDALAVPMPTFVTLATTLLDLFDANVNGLDVPRGKPDPGLFLAAAEALGIAPAACFVVEDAPAGVAAAKAGGMYAIGVARHDDAAALREAGADIVTTSLDTVELPALLGVDDERGANR